MRPPASRPPSADTPPASAHFWGGCFFPAGWTTTIPVCAYVVNVKNAAAADKDGLLQARSGLPCGLPAALLADHLQTAERRAASCCACVAVPMPHDPPPPPSQRRCCSRC